MSNINYYSVLFTGGIDSTYRLCKLMRDEKAVVRPIYIMFTDTRTDLHVRPETVRELESQDKILRYLYRSPNTKAKLLPIRRIQRDEIPKDPRIMALEKDLIPYNFGWQYLYIALLAKWEPGLELCHETLPKEFLNDKVKFKDIEGRRWTDTTGMDEMMSLIFKDVTWPILGVSRQQMVADLKKWGYDGVWKHIWFCYESLNGKPCGMCDNCRVKIFEGLKFLFDKEAIHRCYVYTILSKFSKKAPIWYRDYMRYGESVLYFQFNELDKFGREAQARETYSIIKILEKMPDAKILSLIHEFEGKENKNDELMKRIFSYRK